MPIWFYFYNSPERVIVHPPHIHFHCGSHFPQTCTKAMGPRCSLPRTVMNTVSWIVHIVSALAWIHTALISKKAVATIDWQKTFQQICQYSQAFLLCSYWFEAIQRTFNNRTVTWRKTFFVTKSIYNYFVSFQSKVSDPYSSVCVDGAHGWSQTGWIPEALRADFQLPCHRMMSGKRNKTD